MKNGKGIMAVVGALALVVSVCFADERPKFEGNAKSTETAGTKTTKPARFQSRFAQQTTTDSTTSGINADTKHRVRQKYPQGSRSLPFEFRAAKEPQTIEQTSADAQFWSSLDELKKKRDKHNVHADFEKSPKASAIRTVQAVDEDLKFELTPFEVIDDIIDPETTKVEPTAFAEPAESTPEFANTEAAVFGSPAVAEPVKAEPKPFDFTVPKTVEMSATPVVTPQSKTLSTQTVATQPQDVGVNPIVTVQWVKSGPINVGQESDCFLVVRNSGKGPAGNVALDAFFPTNVELVKVDPKPESSGEFLTWSFGELAAGEERRVHLQMVARERGEVQTRAFVRYSGQANGQFVIHEPLLKISIKGPKRTLINEAAPHTLTVNNPGTGVARNVVVKVAIPPGLSHRAGDRLVMDIGQLNPGESRDVRLALTASEGGNHPLRAQSTADGSLVDTAETTVVVIAPKLQLAIAGPKIRYIGRNTTYTLNLTNDGTAPSNNVRTKYQIPAGFRFAKADKGGKHDATSNSIHWFVGRVNPGEGAEFKVQLTPYKLGDYSHQAGAVSESGHSCSAMTPTRVEGIASLVLEIVDRDDPLEIGAATVYQIRVSNEGSKAAQNVGLSCELPTGIRMVSAKGASDHSTANGMLVFNPLRILPPGKTAIYEVEVRSTQAGSQRFRARIASDSLQQPLVSDELTQVYAD